MNSEPNSRISPGKVRRICALFGLFALMMGLTSAAWVWETSETQPNEADITGARGFISPDDSAKYQRQVEIYSGKLGLLMDKWTRTAKELSHGKPLAETILVSTLFLSGGSFLLAALLKRLDRPDCN